MNAPSASSRCLVDTVGAGQLSAWCQLLDADGNGEISSSEFTKYVETSMKAAGMKNTLSQQETAASKVAEMEQSELEQEWQGVCRKRSTRAGAESVCSPGDRCSLRRSP